MTKMTLPVEAEFDGKYCHHHCLMFHSVRDVNGLKTLSCFLPHILSPKPEPAWQHRDFRWMLTKINQEADGSYIRVQACLDEEARQKNDS